MPEKALKGAPLLEVSGLSVHLPGAQGFVKIVDNLNFTLAQGSVLGLVGESGSGKSIACASMVGLLPKGASVTGSVRFGGRELTGLSERQLEEIRGADIGYVFQDPLTSLNPTMTIGAQIAEPLRRHRAMGRRAAFTRAVELLDLVGIASPRERANAYPHEFSGGMRQRALIAMAVACQPKLVIADEPTTALDVTVQAQILELLLDMRESMGLSLLFISHDLGVIANICDNVAVMYAGEIVEQAAVQDLFAKPAHPYTGALLQATRRTLGQPLATLEGAPPAPGKWSSGCRFKARCKHAADACELPPPLQAHHAASVRCFFPGV